MILTSNRTNISGSPYERHLQAQCTLAFPHPPLVPAALSYALAPPRSNDPVTRAFGRELLKNTWGFAPNMTMSISPLKHVIRCDIQSPIAR